MENSASGSVIRAFGNLLHVKFEGNIRQGEVSYVKVGEKTFASEVIEISKDIAKVQVFEDTRDVKLNTKGTSFIISYPDGKASLFLNILGKYNVYNALAAFSVGYTLFLFFA